MAPTDFVRAACPRHSGSCTAARGALLLSAAGTTALVLFLLSRDRKRKSVRKAALRYFPQWTNWSCWTSIAETTSDDEQDQVFPRAEGGDTGQEAVAQPPRPLLHNDQLRAVGLFSCAASGDELRTSAARFEGKAPIPVSDYPVIDDETGTKPDEVIEMRYVSEAEEKRRYFQIWDDGGSLGGNGSDELGLGNFLTNPNPQSQALEGDRVLGSGDPALLAEDLEDLL